MKFKKIIYNILVAITTVVAGIAVTLVVVRVMVILGGTTCLHPIFITMPIRNLVLIVGTLISIVSFAIGYLLGPLVLKSASKKKTKRKRV